MIDTKRLGLAGVTVTWMVFAGCGSGSSSSCENAAGCGGDIVGAWTITSSCVNISVSMLIPDCPALVVRSSNPKVTGNVTYNADMTFSSTNTIAGDVTMTFPTSCLAENGVAPTCAQVSQSLANAPGVTGATCSGTSTCTCTFTPMSEATTAMGTYTVTPAGLLTETVAGESPSETNYCVKGNTLTVSPRAGSSMMGQEMISGTVTFTKS